MHAEERSPAPPPASDLHRGSGVEGPILEGLDETRDLARAHPKVTRKTEAGRTEPPLLSSFERGRSARAELEPVLELEPGPGLHVVGDPDVLVVGDAGPRPRLEPLLEGRVAAVAVEVAAPLERQARPPQPYLGATERRERLPEMLALPVDRERRVPEDGGAEHDVAVDRRAPRARPFAEVDDERVPVPADGARADVERPARAADGAGRALGQRPLRAATMAERDVDGREVERVDLGARRPRARVSRRERTPEERDDDDRALAVVAQRIEIEPLVAARRDRRVEAKSSRTASAESLPLRAAIGTPGPGCTLPPAT